MAATRNNQQLEDVRRTALQFHECLRCHDVLGAKRGVHQVWQFILPPLVSLFVLVTLIYYIAPGLLPRALSALPLVDSKTLIDQELRETLAALGLTTLLPLLTAVGLIFLLYLVQGFVLALGHLLPGKIVVLTEAQLVHAARPERLAKYWAQATDTEDAHEAVAILLDRFERADASLKHNYKFWQETSGKYYRWLNTTKVFFLWSVLLPFIARYFGIAASPTAALLFALVFSLVGLYAVARHIYAKDQQGFAQVRVIEQSLYDKSAPQPDQAHITELRKQLVARGYAEDLRWWEFRLIDWYFLKWLRGTFVSSSRTLRTHN